MRVTEHQDGDKVDLQVHVPNGGWGIHISTHRGVRIEVQVPSDTALDLHSGDGHIGVDGISARLALIPATATSKYATLAAACAPTPATVT